MKLFRSDERSVIGQWRKLKRTILIVSGHRYVLICSSSSVHAKTQTSYTHILGNTRAIFMFDTRLYMGSKKTASYLSFLIFKINARDIRYNSEVDFFQNKPVDRRWRIACTIWLTRACGDWLRYNNYGIHEPRFEYATMAGRCRICYIKFDSFFQLEPVNIRVRVSDSILMKMNTFHFQYYLITQNAHLLFSMPRLNTLRVEDCWNGRVDWRM